MKIEKLDWDTNFFEINVGRLKVDANDSFDFNEFINIVNKECYELVYVVTNNKMLSYEQIINANLDLVDIQIAMTKELNNEINDYGIELKNSFSNEELEQIYQIVEKTSIVSRFYNEPMIGKYKAINLYKKWVDNALNKTFCDGMFVEYDLNKIIGVNIIKTNYKEHQGICSLIGVDDKYKGQGIGKKLWTQAFKYWQNIPGINSCKVNFSLKNTDSFNFHLRIGFNITAEINFIYHFRSKKLLTTL